MPEFETMLQDLLDDGHPVTFVKGDITNADNPGDPEVPGICIFIRGDDGNARPFVGLGLRETLHEIYRHVYDDAPLSGVVEIDKSQLRGADA